MLQYKSTLQPYIVVRVDAGVELWAWTTVQPYNTNLPTNRKKKLPAAMAKQAVQYREMSPGHRGGGAVKKYVTIFCLPEKVRHCTKMPA